MKEIREALDRYPGKLAFSFNGGKDNMVLLDLLRSVTDQLPVAIFLEEEQFPQLNTHMKIMVEKYKLELLRLQSLFDLKRLRPEIEAIFMGTRRTDPGAKDLTVFAKSTDGWPDYILIRPILNWSYHQVWEHLINRQVPFCSLYVEGYTSLGIPERTQKNPRLKRGEEYLPAWFLEDDADERLGRN